MREPHTDNSNDEHVHPVNLTWYRDEEGYVWPTPAEGRVLVDPSDDTDTE